MPPPLLTPRQRLAATAIAAALSVDGVVAGNAGAQGTFLTGAGPARLPGVLAVARQDGRVDLDLQLTARVVPLHPLGEAVGHAVTEQARAAGLEDVLGRVTVRFADVVHPLLTVSAAA